MTDVAQTQPILSVIPDKLVDTRRLAKALAELGVKEKWAREAADKGDLPCVRIGKKVLFSAEAVKQHLLMRATQPSPVAHP